MSKELVISSNSHETRVALLEDDQLVEIFFQRQQEYSLAGSIHKGRVTRVLPGMQSAFVDIGLERDAFLYVSDFFEDNEEYDRIVTGVEDRALKAERPPEVRGEEAPAAPAPAPVTEPSPATPPSETRDARDRRGRRGRRRRERGKPRGFPETKFATPEPRASAGAGVAEEFSVLPGESLAKYVRTAGEAAPSEDAPPMDVPLEASGPEAEPDWTGESLAAEMTATAAPAEAPPEEAAPAAADDTFLMEDVPPAGEPPPVEEPVSEEAAPADAFPLEEIVEPEGVEPARIPTSLTATLREQGLRYPHRVSRRMRRKMRGGMPEEGRRPDTPPEPKPEARVETRAVSRPERERPPQPSIADLLKEGQEIIVQIAKEPLGQKGARITSYVALPGRFVVYMPTVDHVGVSRKISSDEERQRLKRILLAHRQGIPGGFILRTAGEGKSEEDLRSDMHFLYNLWMEIRQKAEKKKAPALIHHDLDVVERVLRDQLTPSFKAVWVDNEEVYENIVSFVQRFQPGLVNRIKLYTRPTPIFDAFNITSELEKALRPKVWLKSGGYIVINQTEALVAIDINTGKFVGKSNRLEDTIVKTNTDAIREIVRQIRLRDLGGIIVVDFIDMDERKNRQKVMQALEEAMRADRAPYKILSFNDFGLVAITRKRVKQSLERTLCSPCPYCDGAGYVKSVPTVIGEILQEANKIARAVEGSDVLLRVNPEVAKILKSTKNDYLAEIEEILGRPVIVKSDPLLHQEKFDLA